VVDARGSFSRVCSFSSSLSPAADRFCCSRNARSTRERTLSYVFYFHKEPKGFRGGEFRLYHSRITEGRYECGEPVVDIAPINNSILFFLSYRHHEVLPVHCPSRRFADGRFTINGWVRQRQ
jgi:SM-20-related protein